MSDLTEPRFPDVVVQLSGHDGNVFAIVGRVARALREAGYRDEAKAFSGQAYECDSYDEVLRLVMATVEVE